MPTMTITAVGDNVRNWDSQLGGPMKSYRVDVNNGVEIVQGVEWARKASSPAPTAGQQVDATLEDRGQHGFKLKVAPAFGGGQFGPRPEDPKRAARILRQHSQHMALQTIALLHQGDILDLDQLDTDRFRGLVKKWADWFDEDAEEAAR